MHRACIKYRLHIVAYGFMSVNACSIYAQFVSAGVVCGPPPKAVGMPCMRAEKALSGNRTRGGNEII